MPSATNWFYPCVFPPGSRSVSKAPGSSGSISSYDRASVILSSLFFVGSLVWVPVLWYRCFNFWKNIKTDTKSDKIRKHICGTILIASMAVAIIGPHRRVELGKRIKVRKWSLWKSWLNYFGWEVVSDSYSFPSSLSSCNDSFDIRKHQTILAIIPHGLFPFPLAFAALPEQAQKVFGTFRPVVATATGLFPFVRTFLGWLDAVDASRKAVDRALSQGDSIGLAPGGIAEMFEGYPKPLTHPDDEYAIVKSRKGFIRMSIKHGVPVVPIYVFGATKLMKRLQLPAFFEYLSNLVRISICIVFGRWGLPIPFKQRLLYVIGQPIFPPAILNDVDEGEEFKTQVDVMHKKFCDQLVNLFDQYKGCYGWEHKRLCLV